MPKRPEIARSDRSGRRGSSVSPETLSWPPAQRESGSCDRADGAGTETGKGQEVKKNLVRFIPFALIWPIVQLLAPYIIKLIIPLILEKVKVAEERGEAVTITDDEIAKFLDRHESNLRAVYQR